LADVAREAGVSTGIIHYHFRYKDDLLLAALDWAGDQISTSNRCRCRSAASARQQLELSVPHEGLLRDELLLWLEVWLRARHRPNLILESYKLSVSWQQRMTAAIEQARSPAP